MAKRRDHQPLQVERTRTSSTWVSIAVAVVFLVLLIIFIAQNDRKVPLHFFGASGTVSEALALIAAAVGGAALVLAVGVARIVQLRIGGRRHNRAVARRQDAAQSASPPVGEAQPVEPEG
jgi:putative membrane protein